MTEHVRNSSTKVIGNSASVGHVQKNKVGRLQRAPCYAVLRCRCWEACGLLAAFATRLPRNRSAVTPLAQARAGPRPASCGFLPLLGSTSCRAGHCSAVRPQPPVSCMPAVCNRNSACVMRRSVQCRDGELTKPQAGGACKRNIEGSKANAGGKRGVQGSKRAALAG